jgi:hypothetical protein
VAGRDLGQVGFGGDGAAQPADGVLNAAFLPRGIGITEEGGDVEAVQFVVPRELCAIIEGDRLAQFCRQRLEQFSDDRGDGQGSLALWLGGDEQP